MQGKVFGIPLIIIILVVIFLVPLLAADLMIYRSQKMIYSAVTEQAVTEAVVKEEPAEATPTAEISPEVSVKPSKATVTKPVKKIVLPAEEATPAQ